MTKVRILQIIAIALFLTGIYRGCIAYTSENLRESPENSSLSYGLDDHLNYFLFSSGLNLHSEEEEEYFFDKRQFPESFNKWVSVRDSIVKLIYRNHQLALIVQEYDSLTAYNNFYNFVDKLISNDLSSFPEEADIKRLYNSILINKDDYEMALTYIDNHIKIIEPYDQIILPAELESIDDLSDLQKGIIYRNLYITNLSILLIKYKDEIPDYTQSVEFGHFMNSLPLDTIVSSRVIATKDQRTYIRRFKNFVSGARTKSNIEAAYTLMLERLSLSKLEISEVQSIFREGMKDFDKPPQNFNEIDTLNHKSVRTLLNRIVKQHNGRVIYLNLWSPNCKGSIKSMERSSRTRSFYSDKEVSFVYLCGGGCSEKTMRSVVDRIGLDGDHHLISDKDLEELYEIFGKRGFPNYRLIDRNGYLVRGFQVRPSRLSTVRFYIDPLLKE